MIDEFIRYIEAQQLFKASDKILLAVSGGIDSVAMLNCFKEAGRFNFGVAHCNFGLRGEESDGDEAFVKKLAKRCKVPFYSHSFETETFAAQEKISIQMAARRLRYVWFDNLLRDYKYDFVATAHHRNDVLETFLFNVTKGTGIAGLHGISNKLGKTVRPMLFADKEWILDYVAEKQLTWREDSSNESVKYARNQIRHKVIPELKKINPDLENTFQQTIERISQVEEIFLKQVEKTIKRTAQAKGSDVYFNLKQLAEENIKPALFFEIIKNYGFNYVQAKDIYERLSHGPGKRFESGTHQLNIDREAIIISQKDLGPFIPVAIHRNQKEFRNKALHLLFSIEDAANFKITSQKGTGAFDMGRLTFPLEIRKWKRGDYFFPLGMKQKKKLSDFMIDEKIPLNLKERVFLLTSGGEIVWVIGYRIDDRFKITEGTKSIFKAQIATDHD